MATAVFKTTVELANLIKAGMERRSSSTYPGLTIRPAMGGLIAADGKPQEVMFLIGAFADYGEDCLQRFTL